ncbi:hypothetical protein M422DRAFT_776587 [Sphaerobolus stellatus SS14]|nr:hypothetical protein M422DRAFT_776587 [Sphaerobolus stellatus SS14]
MAFAIVSLLSLFSLSVIAAEHPFNLTTLFAPDGSINAIFVPFGATLTELWVKDKHDVDRDVIMGYDNNVNASNVYHIPMNDHEGQDTLHSGIYGWDRRNWTVVSHSKTSITFAHVDNADEGFLVIVRAVVAHTVSNGGILKSSLKAVASEKTHIMITQHIYWNLDAFQREEGQDVLNHTLRIDSSRVPAVDGDSIPTGPINDIRGTILYFRAPKKIGSRIDEAVHTGNYPNTPRKTAHGGPTLSYTKWSAVAIEQTGWLDAINTPEWHVDQTFYPGKDLSRSTTDNFSKAS